jgi:hypothetical protein
VSAALGAGTYYFAVVAPGGQADPNAGATDLLSSDAAVQREFSVDSSGNITNLGNHVYDSTNNKLSVWPYDDTPNPGGVYILAVCQISSSQSTAAISPVPTVAASSCKYDAYKVKASETSPASPPSISKDASGAYDLTYTWGITKSACAHGVTPCKTTVDAASNVTFDYTVTVTHDAGTSGNVTVSGTISVFDPNVDSSNNTVPLDITSVTDQLSDGTNCTVTNGGAQTLTQFQTDFSYSCSLSGVPAGSLDNTATVTWPNQTVNGQSLTGSHTSFTFTGVTFTANPVGNCVTVTDNFNNAQTADTLGTFCVGGTSMNVSASSPAVTASYTSPTWTLTYSRTVSVVADQCKGYQNTATFSGANITSGLSGTGSATVTVCGPASGGLTMGFWQNKNGQNIIKSYSGGTSGTTLHAFLAGFHPFSDETSTTGTGIASYVYNVIKAATCTSTGKTCNSMLKAQMLATALDVYFSDPTLGGDRIAAFNGGNTVSLGGVKIDLTNICHMIDGSGGTASCSGTYENVSSAFGGATSLTVLQMLQYQNTADPLADAGAAWYGQVKATQVLAKDAFDAINNGVAFVSP